MVDSFEIERKWWNSPPNAAFEGVAFPCTPIGFDFFQSTHLVNRKGDEYEIPPELGFYTWGELFPSTILLRFMRGLVGVRGKLPAVATNETHLWHFMMTTMLHEHEWVGMAYDNSELRRWVFGKMYDEATPTEKEGMDMIIEVFQGVSGGYTGVKTPIEMGIINHDLLESYLFDPIEIYNFDREAVIEGMEMLNEKQAFAWTTDGLMV